MTALQLSDKMLRFVAHHDRIGPNLRDILRQKADENDCFTLDEIFSEWPIVFAVWPDESRPSGIGLLCVRGYHLGRALLPEAHLINCTACWCDSLEAAVATFADGQ